MKYHIIPLVVGLALLALVMIQVVKVQAPRAYAAYAKRHSAVGTGPFLDLTDFPAEVKLLQENWKTIADEVANLSSQELTQIKGDLFFRNIADNKWKKLYLKWYRAGFDPVGQAKCPRTCALLAQLPSVRSAMISHLEPGAYIKPHRGPFGGIVRLHLGLDTPNDPACFITVDGRQYHWKNGEVAIFDDTYEHHVENNTDQTRTILFCDLERPMSTRSAQTVNQLVTNYLGPLTSRANRKKEQVTARKMKNYRP